MLAQLNSVSTAPAVPSLGASAARVRALLVEPNDACHLDALSLELFCLGGPQLRDPVTFTDAQSQHDRRLLPAIAVQPRTFDACTPNRKNAFAVRNGQQPAR